MAAELCPECERAVNRRLVACPRCGQDKPSAAALRHPDTLRVLGWMVVVVSLTLIGTASALSAALMLLLRMR